EKNILKRGILDEGAAEYGIVNMNTKDPTFKSQVAEWCEKVKARPRVFLGYCGKAHTKWILYLAALYSIKSIEPREDSVLCFERRVFLFAARTVSRHTHGSSLNSRGICQIMGI